MSDEFTGRTPCCGAPDAMPGPCWKDRPGCSFEGCVRWHLPYGDVPEMVRECTWCDATWLESDSPERDADTDEDGCISYGYANADSEDDDTEHIAAYPW